MCRPGLRACVHVCAGGMYKIEWMEETGRGRGEGF